VAPRWQIDVGQCGAENPPEKKFCGDCGSALGKAVGAAIATPSPEGAAPNIRVTSESPDDAMALEGERKTVTALFAEIKGSTELMEDLDPEEARRIIDPALRIMIDAAHRDGYVVQSTGDGIRALFGRRPTRTIRSARGCGYAHEGRSGTPFGKSDASEGCQVWWRFWRLSEHHSPRVAASTSMTE